MSLGLANTPEVAVVLRSPFSSNRNLRGPADAVAHHHLWCCCLSYQEIMSWMPRAEDRLQKMAPPAAEVRSVLIQLEELKVINITSYLDLATTLGFL